MKLIWDVTPQIKQLGQSNAQNFLLALSISTIAVLLLYCLLSFFAVVIEEREKLVIEATEMRKEAELANQTKSKFLANMSHELRTPLNAIIGFSEVMMHKFLRKSGIEKYEEYAKDINDSGLHLLNLINDILDISKIEAGEVDLIETDFVFHEVSSSSMLLLGPMANKKNVEIITQFDCDTDLELIADIRIIKQIIINLTSNAIKFSDDHSKVIINVSLSPINNFIFKVIDQGVGIPKDELKTVLMPFHQARQTMNSATEGTGLGLALVHEFTRLHGGELTLESEFGVGTIVSMQLSFSRIKRQNEKALAVS